MNAGLPELKRRFPRGVCLLDSVTVIEADDGYELIANESWQLEGLSEARGRLFRELKQGATWQRLAPFLEQAEASAILLALDERQLLVERLEPWREGAQERQLTWLAHFVAAPEHAQGQLRRQHALIVGGGGTGGIVAQHLASIGVGALTLVDFDKVELSNFNRQLPFRRRDIGVAKVEALREHVMERHPACRVTSRQLLVASERDLERACDERAPTVVFCCADTPVGKINASVARAAEAWDVPCVFGSVGVLDGAVGPLFEGAGPSLTAFIAAMDELGRLAERVVGKAAMGSSFSPVNTLIAAHMVLEWAKHARGLGACQIIDQSVVLDCRDGSRRVEHCWSPSPAARPVSGQVERNHARG